MNARPQRRSGNLAALKVELWAGIRVAAAMVDDPDTTPELKLRAVSALATAASVYQRLLEATPADPMTPEIPGDIIVIRAQQGSNGQHA